MSTDIDVNNNTTQYIIDVHSDYNLEDMTDEEYYTLAKQLNMECVYEKHIALVNLTENMRKEMVALEKAINGLDRVIERTNSLERAVKEVNQHNAAFMRKQNIPTVYNKVIAWIKSIITKYMLNKFKRTRSKHAIV